MSLSKYNKTTKELELIAGEHDTEQIVANIGSLSNLTTSVKTDLVSAINEVNGEISTKQDVLTFDDEPTANSNNPVKSGGVFDVVNAITGSLSDNAPYILRKALGNLVYEKIVGCSFVKNQCIIWSKLGGVTQNRISASFDSTTNILTYTCNVTSTSAYNCPYFNYFLGNHTYIFIIDVKEVISPSSDINISFGTNYTNASLNVSSAGVKQKVLRYSSNTPNALFGLFVNNAKDITVVIKMTGYLIDLTQMFGTEIADYAYSLEQAEAGSGIAWLKSYGFFTKDYYAYDAGSIESVSTSGKKVVGFNLWDEQWEIGTYSGRTGEKTTSNHSIRSKNLIPVIPNNDYYLRWTDKYASRGRFDVAVFFYDVDKKYIRNVGTGITNNKYFSFTVSADVCYINFYVNDYSDAPITNYYNDICINLSDPARNGQYEPYKEVVYSLSNRNLLGVPKLVSGHINYDGDIYDADGGVSEKYGIVDLGTLNWTRNQAVTGVYYIYAYRSDLKEKGNLLCSVYPTNKLKYNDMPDKSMSSNGSTFFISPCINVRDDSYTNAADFKTAMSGVYLVYEKATPTTASAIPFQNPQRAFIDGAEEFIDAEVPVGHESTYYLNEIAPEIEDYVDASINEVSGEIPTKTSDLTNDSNFVNTTALNTALANKVDKVTGKGLSTNDYTNADKAIVDSVTGALAEKADTDDIPDLVSDNLAKGILGNETVLSTDNIPFVSKPMGAGKYQRKKFVGCSYVWNQLVENGDFSDGTTGWSNANSTISVTDNVLTITATADKRFMEVCAVSTAMSFTQGHKMFYSFWIRSSKATVVKAKIGEVTVYNATPTADTWVKSAGIFETTDGTKAFYTGFEGLANVGDTLDVKEVFITDLTQLFGSTAIADYIYNLETATAGAGVAKLKELGFFTEDYYAYDAGSIQSVDIKEYSVLGGGANIFGGKAMIKNALSVHGENIAVNETDDTIFFSANTGSGKTIISFDKYALPNTQYTFMFTYSNYVNSTNMTLVYTDGTTKNVPKVPDSEYESGKHVTTVFTSDENKTISYLRGIWNSGNTTLYADESGIFAKGTTEFEPYHVSTYPLTPTELRGVPMIDANNNIYCDGDEYASDGGHTEKYDIVDLGELNWGVDSNYPTTFYAKIVDIKVLPMNVLPNLLISTSKYTLVGSRMLVQYKNLQYSQGASDSYVYIRDDSFTTAADFKTAMSGVYLVYEKATPTTETLTPFDYPQSVGSLEEIVDYKVEQEDRDVAIPTGHVTEYMGKGGEFILPTLPESQNDYLLAYGQGDYYWKRAAEGTIPTKTSELINDSGFITSADTVSHATTATSANSANTATLANTIAVNPTSTAGLNIWIETT